MSMCPRNNSTAPVCGWSLPHCLQAQVSTFRWKGQARVSRSTADSQGELVSMQHLRLLLAAASISPSFLFISILPADLCQHCVALYSHGDHVCRSGPPRRAAPRRCRQHDHRVCGLRQAHPGQVPAQRTGAHVARRVCALLRLQRQPHGQMLQSRGQALLQERLLQVIIRDIWVPWFCRKDFFR